MKIVYLDGNFLEDKDDQISSKMREKGIFTTLLVKDKKIFFLQDHLDRLNDGLKDLNVLSKKLILNEIEPLIEELLLKNGALKGSFRLRIALLYDDILNIEKRRDLKIKLLLTLDPFEDIKRPLKLTVYPDHIKVKRWDLKNYHFFERLKVREYALEKGFDDALLLNEKNQVLDSSCANFFYIVDKTLVCPDLCLDYFKGIMIKKVIKKAQDLGFDIKYKAFSVDQIPKNANLYIINSLLFIKSVLSINDQKYPIGDLDISF